MARKRVNTKFVIGLGGVLLLTAAIVLGIMFSNWWRERNPAYLLQQANKAQAAGDYKTSLVYLYRAAKRAQATHQPDADKLFMKLGDMYMASSDKEPRFYVAARDSWRQALNENPRNIEANTKLLQENYDIATFYRQVPLWNDVEDSSRKLTELDPKNARAYAYHAEAVFESALVSTVDGVIQAKLRDIINDLDKAMAIDPAMPEPVVVRVRTLIFASMRADAGGSPTDAEALRKQALDLAQTYIKNNPNEPKVSVTLARLYIDFKQPDQAKTLLESVCAAHPDDAQAAQLLADLTRKDAPERAEAALSALAAAMKDSPEGYLRLGGFYEQSHKIPEAIAAFKQVANWPQPGAGIQAIKNSEWQLSALYELSWLNMDLAEHNDIQTKEGRANLADASSFTDRIRTLHPGEPRLDVLDGRLQLIRNNLPIAITFLKKADAILASGDPQGQQWVQIKLMLARAYAAESEWGNALSYLDQILAKFPRAESVILQRAEVLNHTAQYSKALASAEAVLKADPNNELAKRIEAAAYLGLGLHKEYQDVLRTIDSPASLIEQARIRILSNDAESALDMLQHITESDPEYLSAQAMIVLGDMQLGRKDDALKVINAVLAKDPKNTRFQWIKLGIDQPNNGNLFDAKLKIIQGIEEPVARYIALAQLYAQTGDHDKELDNYKLAEKVLNDNPEKNHTVLGEVVDRIFSLSLGLAVTSKDANQQKQYWSMADQYVRKAEMLNLDGVSGKLFQGRLQMARGDKKAGVQTIELAVAARSDYSPAHTILGQAYYDTDRLDQALEEFRKAIDIKPDDVAALKGAIRVLTDTRKADAANLAQASNYLRQALVFAHGDPQLQAYSDMLGDPVEAIRVREKTYQQSPANEDNALRLGYLYLRATPKQYDKAVDIFKKLYDKHPDDLALADNLARLYRETGKTGEAQALLQKFVASTDPKIRYTALMSLADLYRSMNQTKESVAAYQQAIAKQPEGTDEAERRLADMYFDLDDMANAEIVYRKLLDTTATQDIKVLRRLIETMVRQDKYAAADELLDTRILKDHPDDPEGLVLRGFALLRQRKAKEAIACFNKVLDKNGNNLDALHYRAFAQYYLQGDLDQAALDLIRVRDQNPNAINSRLLLARVYRLAHKYPEASKEYQDVITLRPDLVPVRVEYADFLYGLVENLQHLSANSQDEFDYAIRNTHPNENLEAILADSLKRFPDEPIWQVLQGNLQALRGNPSAAQHTLEAVFHSSNEKPGVASAYLAALLQGRNYEEVINLTTRLIAVHPEYSDYYVKRGKAYAATDHSDEALNDFDKAMALSSKDLASFLDVVRQAIQTSDASKAIEHLTARLAANPKDIPTRFGLAQALLNSDRYSEAISTIDPLMNEADASGIKTPVLRVRALAYYENKQYKSALEDYQALLRTEPEDLEALNNVAFMLAENMNRPKEALAYAQQGNKILRTKPVSPVFINNGNLYDTYGWVEYLNNDPDSALRELTRANQIDPLPITYYHLARIYHAQKRDDEARRAAKEALRLATLKKDSLLPDIQQLVKELGG